MMRLSEGGLTREPYHPPKKLDPVMGLSLHWFWTQLAATVLYEERKRRSNWGERGRNFEDAKRKGQEENEEGSKGEVRENERKWEEHTCGGWQHLPRGEMMDLASDYAWNPVLRPASWQDVAGLGFLVLSLFLFMDRLGFLFQATSKIEEQIGLHPWEQNACAPAAHLTSRRQSQLPILRHRTCHLFQAHLGASSAF